MRFVHSSSGTKKSGLSGDGPFRCDHCSKFDRNLCSEKEVAEDPEVRKAKDGRGIVQDGECCNYFVPSVTKKSRIVAILGGGI